MIDAMSIRKQINWDASRWCFSGYLDLGNGSDCDETDEATEALVFMVVSIFAYFLTTCNGISGYTLSQLISHALQRLHGIGVSVFDYCRRSSVEPDRL